MSMRFPKDGPKRRRRSRRELPEGQISQWRSCWTHFRREREAKRAPSIESERKSSESPGSSPDGGASVGRVR